jgi:ABC-2 type transport system permease protein
MASGYLFPVELLPSAIRHVVDWLPFRYQLGLPVEIMTGAYDRSGALWMVARQWGFVVLLFGLAVTTWRTGIKRFEAYGG